MIFNNYFYCSKYLIYCIEILCKYLALGLNCFPNINDKVYSLLYKVLIVCSTYVFIVGNTIVLIECEWALHGWRVGVLN